MSEERRPHRSTRPTSIGGASMSALPDPEVQPFLSAEEAFAIFAIDRKTGYRAIKDGSFPVAVVRVGRLIRVPTAAVVRLLRGADRRPEDHGVEASYPDATASATLGRLAASG